MVRIVFEPAGECIYCGKAGEDLSDEHVVAFALGGDYVLPKASCAACSAITARFEEKVLRGTFWTARSALKLRTRRRKSRLSHVGCEIHFNRIGFKELVDVPIDEVPFSFIIPNYSILRIDGDRTLSTCTLVGKSVYSDDERDRMYRKLYQKYKAVSVSIASGGIEVGGAFEKMLWKSVVGFGWVYFRNQMMASDARGMAIGRLDVFLRSPMSTELCFLDVYSEAGEGDALRDSAVEIHTLEEERHQFIYIRLRFLVELNLPTYVCRIRNVGEQPIEVNLPYRA